MGKIMADTAGLDQLNNKISSVEQLQHEAIRDLVYAQQNLDMEIAASEQIASRLNQLKRRLQRQQTRLEQYSSALNQVKDRFYEVDHRVAHDARNILYRMDKITEAPYVRTKFSTESLRTWSSVNAGLALLGAATTFQPVALNQLLSNANPADSLASFDYVIQFVNDMKFGDQLMFVTKEWKSAFWSMLFGGGSRDQAVRLFMENPEKCRAILKGVIEELCGTEYHMEFSGDEEKLLESIQSLADAAGFEETSAFIDYVNELVGDAGVAEKILKDYSENLAMLESLKELYPESEVLAQTADSLIIEYKSRNLGILMDDLPGKLEEGAVNAVDYLTGSQFGKVDAVIQKVLKDVPAIDSIDSVVYSSALKEDANRALREAVRTMQSDGYSKADVQNYYHSFNTYKSLIVKEYEAMQSYYEPGSTKAAFLSAELDKLRAMTPENYDRASTLESFSKTTGAYGGGGSIGGR